MEGDHGNAALLGQPDAEVVAIIGAIGDQEVGREARDQRLGLHHLVPLARGEHDAQGVAERVDRHVQLCAQTTPRAADGLSLSPPFCPAAC